MTDDTMPLLDALLKRGGGDFMKSLAEEVLARLMAYDVEGQIGAARFERSEARTTQRNGYRQRAFDTRLGTLELKIPKLRKGSYFPAFLEPRRTTEQALVAVIQEAWIKGGDPQGGRPRAGDGDQEDLGEPGVGAVRRHRHACDLVPGAADRGRVDLPVAGRDLPESARGRARDLGRGRGAFGAAAHAKPVPHVYVLGEDPGRVAERCGPGVVVHDRPIEPADLLVRTHLLVHQGGVRMCHEALACGTAQLLLPLHLEHALASRALQGLGVGLALSPPVRGEDYRAALQDGLEHLLRPEVQAEAAGRADELRAADFGDTLGTIVATCRRLAGLTSEVVQ